MVIKSLVKISKKKLLIPLYHSVSNNQPVHIKNLYKVKNVKDFETEIDFILKYFNPIGVKDLVDHVKKEKSLKSNSVIFTFDDGLRELYEVISPILLKKGIPAIFFVNSAFVDNKDLFYRYKASLLIDQIEKNSQNLKEASRILKIKSESNQTVKKAILNINYLNKNLIDEIASNINFNFNVYLKKEKPYLAIEELSSLQKKGFAIGAHSVDHPEFFNISIDQQINQTITSLNWVNNTFNQDYNLFAFPFTDYKVTRQFFDKIFGNNELKLDLSFGCAGIKDDYHNLHLQRIPMETETKPAKNIIVGEYQRYLLKNLIGKNRIYRK